MKKLDIEGFLDQERNSLRDKHMHGVVSEDEFRSELISLGERYLEIGAFFPAIYIFGDTQSYEKLRQTGEMALRAKDGVAALMVFDRLDDQSKLTEVVRLICIDRTEDLKAYLTEYAISDSTKKKLFKHFQSFYHGYGFTKGNVVVFKFSEVLQAAHSLGPNYDLIIGNAKGGLFSAHAFHLLGYNTKVCETHRKGRGATFKWLDSVEEADFAGKKILLLDKDIVSGRSLRRIVRELSIYSYAKLDVFFNWGLPYSRLGNLPNEINEAFHPEKLDYGDFYEVLEIIVSKIKAS